jgi:hypothetical protein
LIGGLVDENPDEEEPEDDGGKDDDAWRRRRYLNLTSGGIDDKINAILVCISILFPFRYTYVWISNLARLSARHNMSTIDN